MTWRRYVSGHGGNMKIGIPLSDSSILAAVSAGRIASITSDANGLNPIITIFQGVDRPLTTSLCFEREKFSGQNRRVLFGECFCPFCFCNNRETERTTRCIL
jgi:hypothetical protein